MTPQQQTTLDLSVYNAVSMARSDLTVAQAANMLRAGWVPAWAPVEQVVTLESVEAAAGRLAALGLVEVDDNLVRIPVRDPRTGRGRVVRANADRTGLVWENMQ